MKQRVTVEQLNELTDEQKQNLREWWDPQNGDFYVEGLGTSIVHEYRDGTIYSTDTDRDGDHWIAFKDKSLPLLSIGQMSHFLFDHTQDWGMHYNDSGVFYTVYLSWSLDIASHEQKWSKDELCNALWEAVKNVL